VIIITRPSGGYECIDASYFESSISDKDAQIADPGCDVSLPDFVMRADTHHLAKPGVGSFSRVSSYSLQRVTSKMWVLCEKHTNERGPLFLSGDCGGSARSIRVTASQLCWLVVLGIVTCFRCPSSLAQTSPSAVTRLIRSLRKLAVRPR
jgi:hypothetical protein